MTNREVSLQKLRKKLPIGIQTFADIRNDEYYYVDKTCHIIELVEYRYIFLSRPRRFGKSLTLDTIDNLFSGNKESFKGLYAEQHWDWDTTHPVIRIGFAEGILRDLDSFALNIKTQLQHNAKKLGITLQDPDHIAGSFK